MSAHTPTPWMFDEVPTSCGRCFRIGSAEIIAKHEASKSFGARTLPAYACLYDDYGSGDTVNKANAAFIVHAVNRHEELIAALRSARATIANTHPKFNRDVILDQLDAAIAKTEART